AISAGRYRLHIDFARDFGIRATGLYRVEADGQSYAFTQFEPDSAREAFPCWDEPGFKIPWQVTVVVPENDIVIGNTAAERESKADGRRTVVFARTHPLPSYLVAVAAGPLETIPIPGLSVAGRVVTAQGRSSLAAEAVRLA